MLDPFCLAYVEINPESRVKVHQGAATPLLMQEGWTSYLVKVHNQAHISAELVPESPNAKPILHTSTGKHRMEPENAISEGEIDNQFLDMVIYQGRPLRKKLSGIGVEYFILQLYTKESGKREVKLGFNVGQGTQDIGFRNNVSILFEALPAVKVNLSIKEEDGSPAMGSFLITDGVERLTSGGVENDVDDYRLVRARSQHWQEGINGQLEYDLPIEKQLRGIFPLPSRRLASKDEFPDFFFQPQIYRYDGEYVMLPPGKYYIQYGRGPEYHDKSAILVIPNGTKEIEAEFRLERWVHMTDFGWYSADHHIHAAGCSHYESPEEGVLPEHMWRQILGEDLNMGNNLTWGPSWYYQKQFFTGENYQLSNKENIMRYDVEVSGFPSSHAGHIVLLNLKEDDYPNTTTVEEWPSWTLPVLKWAKDQGGITGYAHSGWGLEPLEPTDDLPNYIIPKMDGIGANEFVVTVTHDLIDFYSAGDTPLPAELNMWYHVLNAGFKTRISGETDFPCISDEKVGRARIYAELEDGLDFSDYMDALVKGKSYVSDGRSHLIDFKVDNLKLGDGESLLSLKKTKNVKVTIKAAAFLEEEQDGKGYVIATSDPYKPPYWHIERSRKGKSRDVIVELVRNGVVIDEQTIKADGDWNDISFTTSVDKSCWLATRVKYSSHTNPIFIEVDGKPILEKASAEWCRVSVDQCWEQKKSRFRYEEIEDAQKGYDYARTI
ncbi:MAG: CehA/McbA family metallohydrolase, partial [Flavobacteriaceae bacterium]|nr:CehA/McbA family metallohydrolase [Flavobacteriaceae bacterium]